MRMNEKDEKVLSDNIAIRLLKDRMIDKAEQNVAIKYCHDHKLLMIPVDLYHTLNVTYNAYMNNMTYEEAEKLLLEEVKPNE